MSSPVLSHRREKENGTEGVRHRRTLSKNEFRERQSKLDSLGSEREQSEYRGFFNLITMAMAFFFFAAQTRNILYEGTLVGLRSSWGHFNRYDLFPSWLMLVIMSLSPFFVQKIILMRILPRLVTSTLRIAVQIIFGIVGIIIAWERRWPVVQMTFFLLEYFILLMKMHSYIMTNREYDKEYLQNKTSPASSTTTPSANGDEEDSDDEKKKKKKTVKYPENVTFMNYLDFLLVPTLVYEQEYPRTQNIRIGYFIEKLFSFIGLWAVLHVLVENYIVPVLENSTKMTQLEAICQLIIPFTAGYLLIFYLVFDVACNGFAELTKFADRAFYADWWNSKTWDQFARDWNKPVHEFLLRHVYLESINSYKMSKNNATMITFLFSSIVHEFFMGFTLRLFRPWLFVLQMSQLPMIYAMRHPLIKDNRFSNHFFWFGMILGPPLLSLLYAREYYMMYPNGV